LLRCDAVQKPAAAAAAGFHVVNRREQATTPLFFLAAIDVTYRAADTGHYGPPPDY